MQAIRSTGTAPELKLRTALHRAGLRFRKDSRPLATVKCVADVVFRRARVCIFVDGCFWHGCHDHFRIPRTNSNWWREKIADNVRRDLQQTLVVRAAGWRVIRVWEHDLKKDDLTRIVRHIAKQVRIRSKH